MFFSGAAIWYTTFHTTTSSIANLPPSFVAIGQGSVGPSRTASGWCWRWRSVAHVVLARTVLGQRLYAIGHNPRAAAVSGVPVARCVIAGLRDLRSLRRRRLHPLHRPAGDRHADPGRAILLDVIGAVVIGGTSLFGGKGKVIWTRPGVLFLVLIDTSLKLLGLSLFFVLRDQGRRDPPGGRPRRAAHPFRCGARSVSPMAAARGARPAQELLRRRGAARRGPHARGRRVLGLVGENGSGKSTTMNILGGVHPRDGGRDPAGGRALRAARATRRASRRHRLHPPGAEPLREPVDRGEPVHQPVSRGCGRAAASSTADGCASGRDELLGAGRPAPPARHAGRHG